MKKNERSGEQPREESELQQPKVKIELTGDMKPVIKQALQDMTQEQKREIAKAAEAWTGEKPESDLEGAQILYEEYAKHQMHPKIERAFYQIEQGIDTTTQKVQEAISKTQEAPAAVDSEEKEPAGAFATAADDTVKGIKQALEQLTTLIGSGELEPLRNELRAFTSVLQNYREAFSKAALEEAKENLENWAKSTKAAKRLAPYIQQAIEEMGADAVWEDMAIEAGVISESCDDGPPRATMFEKIMQRAKELQATDARELRATGQSVHYARITKFKATTDLLANKFFSLDAPPQREEINGQRQWIALAYEGNASKKEINLLYDYMWENAADKFNDFDWFVTNTLDNLYAAGNDVVSFTKIYHELGWEGSPGQKNLEDIYHSLIKGMSCILTINNSEVMNAWNVQNNGKYQEISSPAMPVIILNERFVVNGNIAEGRVKINGFTPFRLVADPIGHVTAWDKEILSLYDGKRTPRYWAVMRFLMRQIAWMRTGTRSHKLSYSGLYKATGSKSTRTQQLDREMLYRLLDEVFKPAQYITAYKETAKTDSIPGVVLTLHKKRLQLPDGKKAQ